MGKRSYKRRQYFIAAKFQLKFVGIILLFMFAVALFSALTIYYYTWMLLGEKLANIYPQGRLVGILRSAQYVLLIRILIFSPFVAAVAIVLSHRIAGPIYRMKKTLDEVVEGNYSLRLRLRRTDELKDVAESMNKVIEILENKSKEEIKKEAKEENKEPQ